MNCTEKIKLTPLPGTGRWSIPHGVLFYCEDDLRKDSKYVGQIRLWHEVRRGKKVKRYLLKPKIENANGRQPNSRPHYRARFQIVYKGRHITIHRAHVAFLAYYGFSWEKGFVIDHVKGDPNDPFSTLIDDPCELQAISSSENCRRSEEFIKAARRNMAKANERLRELRAARKAKAPEQRAEKLKVKMT